MEPIIRSIETDGMICHIDQTAIDNLKELYNIDAIEEIKIALQQESNQKIK